MTKPIIAVTADRREVAPYMWHMVPEPYVNAATNVADVIPIIVANIGEKLETDTLLDRVDGLLVTGSRSNVHPSHYGVEPTADHEPFDPERDATTLPLIRRAIERGIPVLAICRGIQELNVAMGGSITAAFQEQRNIKGHDYPIDGAQDERFALAHGVKIEPGSCISDILQSDILSGGVRVNSLHTQALDRLGDRVEVEALSEDGTIEAVTVKGAPGFVIGVQWHPEYWAETDSPSNTIFKAFGDACRDYAAGRAGLSEAAE